MSNLEDIKDKITNLEKMIIEKFDNLEKKIDAIINYDFFSQDYKWKHAIKK